MNTRFDRRRKATRALPPAAARKVRQIQDALAHSDATLKDHFINLNTFERSLVSSKTGRVYTGWPETVAELRDELVRAYHRVTALHTGLRAEQRFRIALVEMSIAVGHWHAGLTTQDSNVVETEMEAMSKHFARANRFGKAAAADLKEGR